MRPFLCSVEQKTERSIFDGARCNTKEYLLRSNATACPLQIFTVTFPEAKKDFWNRNKDHATVIFRTCAFQVSMHTPDIPMRYPSSSRPPSPLKLFPTAAATSKRRLLRRLHGRLAQRVRQLQGLLPGWCNRMPCSGVQLQLGTCHSCRAPKKRSRNTKTLNKAVIIWYHIWSCESFTGKHWEVSEIF